MNQKCHILDRLNSFAKTRNIFCIISLLCAFTQATTSVHHIFSVPQSRHFGIANDFMMQPHPQTANLEFRICQLDIGIRRRSNCPTVKVFSSSLLASTQLPSPRFKDFKQSGTTMLLAAFSLLQQKQVLKSGHEVLLESKMHFHETVRGWQTLPCSSQRELISTRTGSAFDRWEKNEAFFFCVSALPGGRHIHHSLVTLKMKKIKRKKEPKNALDRLYHPFLQQGTGILGFS